jgi:hypothetical protein
MSDPRLSSGAPGHAPTLNQHKPAAPTPHVPHPQVNQSAPHVPRPPAAQPHVPHAQHAPQAPRPAVIPQPAAHGARPGIAAMPVQAVPVTEADLDPIELVEDDQSAPAAAGGLAAAPVKSKIKAFGAEHARKEHQWKRTPHRDGKGAIRVKTFHAKYSDQGMEHLDDMINEWIDAHPEVEIKFVTSTVNVFEGKIREPALVLNMWY